MTVAAARRRIAATPCSNRPALLALFGVAGALQFSIAVAQILLTRRARLLGRARHRRRETRRGRPRFSGRSSRTPRVTLVVGGVLARSAHEPDRRASSSCCSCSCRWSTASSTGARAHDAGHRDRHRARPSSAAVGIVQYGILHYDNLGQRPQGTLGHYMTYSGLLMLVIGVGAGARPVRQARSACGRRS